VKEERPTFPVKLFSEALLLGIDGERVNIAIE
jgi:hypothetical protein